MVSVTKASNPTSTVYQSRMPNSPPMRKSIQRGRKNLPEASSGTPRMTLPSAAPKKMASKAPEAMKPASQMGFQTGLSMWFRSSIETPRRINSHNTIINGR
jgi:hypothetical protein